VLFLKERLRGFQWLAVFLAGAGVITTTILFGHTPYISLYLAVSWAFYGLLRKKSPLNSAEGLTIETAILSIPAFIYMFILASAGDGSFGLNISTSLLLVGAGITSGLPLLIFIAGSRMISLSLAGFLQYIYPTLIFIVGVFVFKEPLNTAKLIGFIFIWIALFIYSLEGIITNKKTYAAGSAGTNSMKAEGETE